MWHEPLMPSEHLVALSVISEEIHHCRNCAVHENPWTNRSSKHHVMSSCTSLLEKLNDFRILPSHDAQQSIEFSGS